MISLQFWVTKRSSYRALEYSWIPNNLIADLLLRKLQNCTFLQPYIFGQNVSKKCFKKLFYTVHIFLIPARLFGSISLLPCTIIKIFLRTALLSVQTGISVHGKSFWTISEYYWLKMTVLFKNKSLTFWLKIQKSWK